MSSRSFRPTRRDLFVACISAALCVLWFQASSDVDSFSGVSERDAWNLQSPLDIDPIPNPPGGLLDAPDSRIIIDHPASPLVSHKDKAKKPAEVMPSTTMLGHGAGWTLFENLYMYNGTLLVVSDEGEETFPEKRLMTSTGLPADNAPGNLEAREPTKYDMDFWGRHQTHLHFGNRIYPITNLTILANDPPQFIDHYYHFAAELWLGIQRFLSTYLPSSSIPPSPRGESTMESPARLFFPHCAKNTWRDKLGFNQYFLWATYPSISVETAEDWQGRANMTLGWPGAEDDDGEGGTTKAWRFDRVLLIDRSASFRAPTTGYYTHRTAGASFFATVDKASPYWWETVRRKVLGFAGVPNEVMDWSITEPEVQKEVGMVDAKPAPVVVTYVSRQGWRRRLIEEDHKLLEASVRDVCKSKGWEFILFHPEQYSLDDQLLIAARSTVMFGVHGNGLTHLIAMAPRPISTVIEIFYPGGFARDYQWTAESLGHKHFGVWNDTYFTSPELPSVDYPEGFQGTQIPVHGPTVAKLIADRVEGRLNSKPLPCPAKYCSFFGSEM